MNRVARNKMIYLAYFIGDPTMASFWPDSRGGSGGGGSRPRLRLFVFRLALAFSCPFRDMARRCCAINLSRWRSIAIGRIRTRHSGTARLAGPVARRWPMVKVFFVGAGYVTLSRGTFINAAALSSVIWLPLGHFLLGTVWYLFNSIAWITVLH